MSIQSSPTVAPVSNTIIKRDLVTKLSASKLDELLHEKFQKKSSPLVFSENFQDVASFQEAILDPNPNNQFYFGIKELKRTENLYLVEVNEHYNYRPDLLSYIFYGDDNYYPIILFMNDYASLLEFIPEDRDNQLFILKPEVLLGYLNSKLLNN